MEESKVKRKADADVPQPRSHRLHSTAFGANPTALERAAINYVNSLQDPIAVSPEAFLSCARAEAPKARYKHFASMWTILKTHVAEQSEDEVLRIAFENAAPLSLEEVARICNNKNEQKQNRQKETIANIPIQKRQRSSPGSPALPVQCNITSRNSNTNTNTNTNGSSGSSDSGNGSSRSSTLTPKAAGRMQDEYKRNFDAFDGEPWRLASGTVVDDMICTHTMSLSKESSLHSFVIDRVEDMVRLFEEGDKEAVRNGLSRQAADDSNMETEEIFLRQYLSTPEKTNTALAQGWSSNALEACSRLEESSRKRLYCAMLSIYTVYEEVNFKLPTTQSEAWFLTTLWAFLPGLMKAGGVLDHQPGEILSEATSLRKNSNRTLQSRKIHGRKIDGIFSCATTHYEIGAVEAAKIDDGPQGTKSLSDSRKLSKVLKDMHDRIVANSSPGSSVCHDLVTYGLQIARSKITLYSLHKRPGRHYQLVHDGTFAFPPTWDKFGRAATPILELLVRLLRLKEEMESMADNIIGWTMDTKTGFEREVVVRTLTTPASSPKYERPS